VRWDHRHSNESWRIDWTSLRWMDIECSWRWCCWAIGSFWSSILSSNYTCHIEHQRQWQPSTDKRSATENESTTFDNKWKKKKWISPKVLICAWHYNQKSTPFETLSNIFEFWKRLKSEGQCRHQTKGIVVLKENERNKKKRTTTHFIVGMVADARRLWLSNNNRKLNCTIITIIPLWFFLLPIIYVLP
jgi:hypothetical protein